MNNKGFTLIEVLLSISIIAIIGVIFIVNIGDTFGLSLDKSYEILKKSIITQTSEYIYECDNGLIDCSGDYNWTENNGIREASFYLEVMRKYSYFDEEDFINPITGKYIGNCLIINVTKDNLYMSDITLDDSSCEKQTN